jgi:PAS domain S-box-containing protein
MITADALCGVDREQRIVSWNSAAESLLGYSPGEVQRRFCFEVIAGVDEAGCRVCRRGCAAVEAAYRGEPIATRDLKTHTKAGSPIWLAVTTILPPRSWAADVKLVHVFRDIHWAKLLQQGVEHVLREMGFAGNPFPRFPAGAVVPPAARGALTPRERELLSLLASGATTRQIAETLMISPATVRNHVNNIFAKLHAHSRVEAVAMALRDSLL